MQPSYLLSFLLFAASTPSLAVPLTRPDASPRNGHVGDAKHQAPQTSLERRLFQFDGAPLAPMFRTSTPEDDSTAEVDMERANQPPALNKRDNIERRQDWDGVTPDVLQSGEGGPNGINHVPEGKMERANQTPAFDKRGEVGMRQDWDGVTPNTLGRYDGGANAKGLEKGEDEPEAVQSPDEPASESQRLALWIWKDTRRSRTTHAAEEDNASFCLREVGDGQAGTAGSCNPTPIGKRGDDDVSEVTTAGQGGQDNATPIGRRASPDTSSIPHRILTDDFTQGFKTGFRAVFSGGSQQGASLNTEPSNSCVSCVRPRHPNEPDQSDQSPMSHLPDASSAQKSHIFCPTCGKIARGMNEPDQEGQSPLRGISEDATATASADGLRPQGECASCVKRHVEERRGGGGWKPPNVKSIPAPAQVEDVAAIEATRTPGVPSTDKQTESCNEPDQCGQSKRDINERNEPDQSKSKHRRDPVESAVWHFNSNPDQPENEASLLNEPNESSQSRKRQTPDPLSRSQIYPPHSVNTPSPSPSPSRRNVFDNWEIMRSHLTPETDGANVLNEPNESSQSRKRQSGGYLVFYWRISADVSDVVHGKPVWFDSPATKSTGPVAERDDGCDWGSGCTWSANRREEQDSKTNANDLDPAGFFTNARTARNEDSDESEERIVAIDTEVEAEPTPPTDTARAPWTWKTGQWQTVARRASSEDEQSEQQEENVGSKWFWIHNADKHSCEDPGRKYSEEGSEAEGLECVIEARDTSPQFTANADNSVFETEQRGKIANDAGGDAAVSLPYDSSIKARAAIADDQSGAYDWIKRRGGWRPPNFTIKKVADACPTCVDSDSVDENAIDTIAGGSAEDKRGDVVWTNKPPIKVSDTIGLAERGVGQKDGTMWLSKPPIKVSDSIDPTDSAIQMRSNLEVADECPTCGYGGLDKRWANVEYSTDAAAVDVEGELDNDEATTSYWRSNPGGSRLARGRRAAEPDPEAVQTSIWHFDRVDAVPQSDSDSFKDTADASAVESELSITDRCPGCPVGGLDKREAYDGARFTYYRSGQLAEETESLQPPPKTDNEPIDNRKETSRCPGCPRGGLDVSSSFSGTPPSHRTPPGDNSKPTPEDSADINTAEDGSEWSRCPGCPVGGLDKREPGNGRATWYHVSASADAGSRSVASTDEGVEKRKVFGGQATYYLTGLRKAEGDVPTRDVDGSGQIPAPESVDPTIDQVEEGAGQGGYKKRQTEPLPSADTQRCSGGRHDDGCWSLRKYEREDVVVDVERVDSFPERARRWIPRGSSVRPEVDEAPVQLSRHEIVALHIAT